LSSRDAGPPPPEDERVAAGGAPTPEHSATLAAFSRPEVVEVYTERGSHLWACEEALFDRHLPPGARVLDLGVGTGRTTERLAANATRYVGLDFAPPMVDACRKRFPHLEFVCGDASDLQQFADDSFDVVVFSFNGIDCLHPDAARFRCIRSIRRVLAPGGVLLLSEHNPLVLVSRPRPVLGVPPKLAAARLARAARESLANVVRLVRSNRGSRVDGFYFDPAHGGNWWHAASPNRVRAEFASFGFEPLGEPIGVDHPRSGPLLATAWYYYAFRLPGTARPAVVVEAAATGT
jgi:SAM-dependent methyltransferase